MKCINCGSEIKSEFNICPYCGKPIQIVPDYSIYDDDDINVLLEGTKDVESKNNKAYKKAQRERERQLALEKAEKAKKEQTKKTVMIVGIVCGVFLVIGIIISIIVDINNKNSYDYQMKQADGAMFKEKLEDAEEFYLNALNLEPNDIRVRLDLAKLYLKQEDVTSAIQYLKEVIELDALNYDAYKALYDIYVEMNDTDAILALKEEVTDAKILSIFDEYSVNVPKFNIEGGTYTENMSIALSADQDTEVYYTIDGSDPISNGKKYTDEIELDEGMSTIKAVAKNSLGIYSEIVSQTYVIQYEAPEAPVVTPDGGTFTSVNYVYISVPEGCSAYYTWDRTDPTQNSTLYVSPILIPEGYNILSVIIIDDTTGLESSIYKGAFEYIVE